MIYDVQFEAEIAAIIERDMVISRYSRLDNVVGARMAAQEARSGYLSDRRNRMIIAVAEPETVARIVEGLRALRARKGHGLRAFVVPVSQVI